MNGLSLFSIKEVYSEYNLVEKNCYKLIIIKRGSIFYRFQNTENIITKNTILFVHDRSDISIKQSDESHVLYIMFAKEFLDQIQTVHNKIIINSFFNINIETIKIIQLNEKIMHHASSLMSNLVKEYTNKEPAYMSAIQALFTELLLYFYRSSANIIKKALLSIDEIEFYIKNNYSESFTLNDLAAQCGLNPSYFSRAFKIKTGVGVFEFINRIRIQKACALLKRTDMSIIEIAYSTGYNNVSFFNRYFRKIMNISPRQYKNMLDS